MEKKINNCKECGSNAEVKMTCGGGIPYWAIHCIKCNNNSRGKGYLRGLASLGMGISENVPQNSKEEAIDIWNQQNNLHNVETLEAR